MRTLLMDGGHLATGPVVVLKFGSSLLSGVDGFRVAADEIEREVTIGKRVLAVVSAIEGTTDGLVRMTRDLTRRPPVALVAALLRTGEDASVALLGIELASRNVCVHTVSSAALGLRTQGPLSDADPLAVDEAALEGWLRAHVAVVVPGFVGQSHEGVPSLLGRGGSDLTALFLGHAVGAEEVRLVKDVDGVFPVDPRVGGGGQRPLERATWSEVARVGNGVVQDKALRFAERLGIDFRVAAPGGTGTWVGGPR